VDALAEDPMADGKVDRDAGAPVRVDEVRRAVSVHILERDGGRKAVRAVVEGHAEPFFLSGRSLLAAGGVITAQRIMGGVSPARAERGRRWRGTEEKVTQGVHGIGDVDGSIVVRVGRVVAAHGLRLPEEEEAERMGRIAQVEHAVEVRVSSREEQVLAPSGVAEAGGDAGDEEQDARSFHGGLLPHCLTGLGRGHHRLGWMEMGRKTARTAPVLEG
jgi:hypothetical protein